MWLWLQRRWPKSFTVWARLSLFSTSLHFILLLILFFIYKGENGGLNFEISKNLLNSDAPIMFMPLHKRINQKNAGKIGKKAKAAAVKTKADQVEQAKEQKQAQSKKAEMSTTLVSANKKKMQQKKAAAAKAAAEKSAAAKAQADKALAEQKKQEAAQKLEQQKKLEELEKKQLEELEKDKANDNELAQALAEEDVRYMGREDLDALKMQEFIGAEVSQHWNPPIGVPLDAACEIKLTVDWQGNLNDLQMVQSSNIVVYDVAARNAVKKMGFPKWLWGKEFSITFKQ